jgi:O-acetyl-ADP-ribose deacetylase (regulator of RNase III)
VIRVVKAQLAVLEVQGIVRPVGADLAPANVVARDLVTAAGAELEERLSRLGMLPVGGAVLTPAGSLAADYLIHVVVMSHDEPQSSPSIQKALRNGLRRAADWGLESLALPALGLGAGSMDAETPARVLVEILTNHVNEGVPPLELTIAVSSDFEVELFEKVMAEMERPRTSVGE